MENTWAFPALEALHLVGLALLVGTIVLGDLQVLGFTSASVPDGTLRIGLWVIVTTGAVMFLSDFERYRANPAFLMKMGVLAVLVMFHFTRSQRTTRSKAVLSLVLWTVAVFTARAVIDFDA